MNQEELIQNSWRWFPHTFAQKASKGKWKPYRHLKYLSEQMYPELLAGNARIIVTMPPRHGKSEFISHWLPVWFLDLFPWKRVGLAAYSASFAKKWGKKVKGEFQNNPLVQNSVDAQTKAGDYFQINANDPKRDDGLMMTAGIDGPFTGEGFELIIIDDPIKNLKEANSAVQRQNVKDWYRAVAETRMEPGCSVVILMTRWHEDDLVGWLLNQDDEEEGDPELADDWKVINLPALAEEDDPLGREEGEALCPERYTKKSLEGKMRRVGPRVADSLYQQRPTAAKGDVWKRAWWQYWTKMPTDFDEVIQSWDMSFGSKKKTASWVVGQIWGRIKNDYYLLVQVRDRWSFEESKAEVLDLTAEWPQAYVKLIENKANGPAIENSLTNTITGINLVEPQGGKAARAIACQGAISSGHVYLPDPSRYAWVEGFINEAAAFREDEGHKEDDQVDAASQAIIYFEDVTNSALLKLLNR